MDAIIATMIGFIAGLVVFSAMSDDNPETVTEYIAITEPVPIPYPVPTEITVELTANVPLETYEVSAYTAGAESTLKTPAHPLYGITASGAAVIPNHTAACPPSLDFGTRVYVPARATIYECADRGSAITEGYLDIYMPDLDDARAFGRRELDVLILENTKGEAEE